MGDLLEGVFELVLNVLVELFFDMGESSCGWRLSSNGEPPGALVVGIVAAGVVGGLVWEWQGNRRA